VSDDLPVDLADLAAAKRKLRRLTADAERGIPNLHAAYKAQQFLADALGEAWATCDLRPPDFPDGTSRRSEL